MSVGQSPCALTRKVRLVWFVFNKRIDLDGQNWSKINAFVCNFSRREAALRTSELIEIHLPITALHSWLCSSFVALPHKRLAFGVHTSVWIALLGWTIHTKSKLFG